MREKVNAESWRARARVLAMLAGAMDTTTGALLVAAPAFTLQLMGIELVAGDSAFIRFVGAFVLGVGVSYFMPFFREGRGECDAALRSQFVTTALIRLSVGLFTGIAIVSGVLTLAWISVTLSDLALAAVQTLIVRSKVLDAAS